MLNCRKREECWKEIWCNNSDVNCSATLEAPADQLKGNKQKCLRSISPRTPLIIWPPVMGAYCSPDGAGSSCLWLGEWGQSCGWLDWCRSSFFWLTLAWQESRAARCIFAPLSGFKNRGQDLSSWVNAPHMFTTQFQLYIWTNHTNDLSDAINCAR